ncbi:unnamed protein product [Aphanomyces euteiches]
MSQPCLRNMSCKCPLCMGEDVTELLAITKTISSNIAYGEPGEEEPVAPPTRSGFVANSPPVKPAAAPPVANSPPLKAAAAPAAAPRQSLKSRMKPQQPPPPVDKLPPLDFEDVDMGNGNAAQADEPAPVASSQTGSSAPSRPTSSDPPLQMEELEAKVADKNWKIRKEVYEDLKTAFETGRGIEGGNVTELFGKMVDDSNAAAMECGLAAVLAYALQVPPQQWNNAIVGRVMPKVVDKCFSGRPSTVKLAEELVLEFVHLGSAEDTVNALLEGTKNKKPKVPPLCVNSILECFKTYGPRVVPVVAVKKELKSLCESTVNNVRPTALKLIGEMYRWTGPTLVQDIVASLRPAQQTEYENMIKEITPGQAAPLRFLKGKEPKAAPAKGGKSGGNDGGGGAPAPSAMDPREFAETVSLFDKLPKTEFKAKMALPKWSEKVGALNIILEIIGSVPKLANGDYGDLVQTLKLCTQDSNVNIVAKSIEVLGVLADGLRRNFNQYARIMLPVLLRKLSDKKSNVLSATHQALDMFQQHSLPIDSMMDELKTMIDASTNKIPASRAQAVIFIERCISKKTINIMDANLMKTFGELFASCIEDSDPGLRKSGVDAMVTLVQSSDQAPRMVKATLDTLERRQPRSFKTIEASMGGGGQPTASSVPKTTSSAIPKPATSNSVPKEAAKPPATAPARANTLKKSASAPSATKPSAKPAAKSSSAAASSETITLAPAEAEQQLTGLGLDGWDSITTNFQSAKWAERKAAFEGLEEAFKGQPADVATANIDAVVVHISSQTKGFKDSNVQVLKSAFQAVGTIAALCDILSPAVINFVIPPAVDKIGDRKLSESIRPMFMAFCELVGPTTVLTAIITHMPNVKTPLALCECLDYASECVKDFGVSKCNPRGLIDFAKGPFGMESSNPKARVSAISLFGTMYTQLGDAMRPLLTLDTWKASMKDNVESEFKRVGFNPSSSTVTRQVKGEAVEEDKSDGSLFGRVDISSKITKDLLDNMQNEEDKAAWKKRSDAMDQAQKLCEEAGLSIELTKNVTELMKSLKARLSDSNANLKTKAVVVIGVVATSVGPSVSKLAKLVGNNIVVGVSDNKKAMQQACLETLNKWVVHNGKPSAACFESLLPFIAEALKNTVGRAELLGWTVSMTQTITDKMDLRCLVENTIDSLLDKSAEAREKAQLLLVDVFKSAGKDAVLAGCRDFVPAKMRTLKPLIDKASQAAFGQSSAEEEKPRVSMLGRSNSTGIRAPSSAPAVVNTAASSVETPQSSRIPAPGSAPVAATVSAPTLLLMCSDKLTRLDKNRKNKWIFDATDPAELQSRKAQVESEWSPLLHSSMRTKLFAVSYEKGMMEAIDDLSKCIKDQPNEVFSSLDLILKWSTLRIVDNNVQALGKMLKLLEILFLLLVDNSWELDDVEAGIFLPYLCQESGQQKPRFRCDFRKVLQLVVQVYPPVKLMPYLLECITNTKNSKSRCECLDLIEYIASNKGHSAVGKKTLRDVGKFVDSPEKEVRESAIGVLVKMYTLIGETNTDKFFVICNITSQKAMDLVLQKIKYLPPPERGSAKPTLTKSASMPVEEPAREPQSTYEPPPVKFIATFEKPISRLERPATPSKVQTPAFAEPPSTTPPTFRPDFHEMESKPTTRTDIRNVLFQPLERLMINQKELTMDLDAFAAGKDALKSVYSLAANDSNAFLRQSAVEVVQRICQIMHACFGKNTAAPVELYVLSLCLSAIAQIFKHSVYCITVHRAAIERLILESCCGILDPRLEDLELSLAQRVLNAMSGLSMTIPHSLRISEVLPAIINVLDRIVRGNETEYTIHDKDNKLMGKPSLERLVSKLLMKTARRELTLPTPFKDVDIVGILHAKHRFFTTISVSDENAGRNAMKTSLKCCADHWSSTNREAFQQALNELPISSPIHQMLSEMKFEFTIPSPEDISSTLNEAVHTFSISSDNATKMQSAMTIIEVKMNSSAKIEIDGKKEELRQVTEKLKMEDYNRTKAAASDSALKSTLSRSNIFKDRSIEVASSATSATTTPSREQPPKSMALMDLKQRLKQIQMHN